MKDVPDLTVEGKKVFKRSFFNEGRKTEITIEVDLTIPNTRNYITVKAVSDHRDVDMAVVRSQCPREIANMYPLTLVSNWQSDGITLLCWFNSLADKGVLIPTDKERNGGRSNWDLVRAGFRSDVSVLK